MTPICGTNRGETLPMYLAIWPQDTCHLHRNKYGKEKFVRSWKAFPDLKIQIGSYFKSEKCYTETLTKMLQSKNMLTLPCKKLT